MKIKINSRMPHGEIFEIEYEGSEEFLKTELPSLLKMANQVCQPSATLTVEEKSNLRNAFASRFR